MFVKRYTVKEIRKLGQWLLASSEQCAMPHLTSDPQVFSWKKKRGWGGGGFLSVHIHLIC